MYSVHTGGGVGPAQTAPLRERERKREREKERERVHTFWPCSAGHPSPLTTETILFAGGDIVKGIRALNPAEGFRVNGRGRHAKVPRLRRVLEGCASLALRLPCSKRLPVFEIFIVSASLSHCTIHEFDL